MGRPQAPILPKEKRHEADRNLFYCPARWRKRPFQRNPDVKIHRLQIDRLAEIERLAALGPIDYEAVRSEAAQRIGVRATILDREVAKQRRALELEPVRDERERTPVMIYRRRIAMARASRWRSAGELPCGSGQDVCRAARRRCRHHRALDPAHLACEPIHN